MLPVDHIVVCADHIPVGKPVTRSPVSVAAAVAVVTAAIAAVVATAAAVTGVTAVIAAVVAIAVAMLVCMQVQQKKRKPSLRAKVLSPLTFCACCSRLCALIGAVALRCCCCDCCG